MDWETLVGEPRIVETTPAASDRLQNAMEGGLGAGRLAGREHADLLATVAHELRTPLAHIKGYTTTLLQTDVTWDAETQHDFLARIDSQVDRLSSLVTALLEHATPNGGVIAAECRPTAADELIERGIEAARLDPDSHTVTAVRPPELPTVRADCDRIERVFANLIDNAAKFAPVGTPIRIEAVPRPGEVEFAVIDHGPGLRADELTVLFAPFYRSPQVRRRVPGNGLGLAICRQIVEAHGGRIWVDSQPGQGCAFRFTLQQSPPAVP